MREIKFRAWDKINKQILDVVEISFIKDLHLQINRKGIIGINRKGDYYNLSFDDVELMQYTCLKDENGKEIYEGDIVISDKLMKENKDKGIVRWMELDGCFAVNTNAYEIFTVGKQKNYMESKLLAISMKILSY